MDGSEHNLKRFIDAQLNTYDRALSEIKNGKKHSHWMWYIFPQINGLGRSSTAKLYAISSREEAIDFFQHPILGVRLLEITTALLKHDNKTAYEIFGHTDQMKLKSSMTLFDSIQEESTVFKEVLKVYFENNRCYKTVNFIEMN